MRLILLLLLTLSCVSVLAQGYMNDPNDPAISDGWEDDERSTNTSSSSSTSNYRYPFAKDPELIDGIVRDVGAGIKGNLFILIVGGFIFLLALKEGNYAALLILGLMTVVAVFWFFGVYLQIEMR
ncbi:hypothetical protein M0R01_04865 [bacterium]|nr:hypothetical protein [bacterium]